MSTGTAGWTRVKRSRNLDSNMGGEAFKRSERCIRKPYLLGLGGPGQFKIVDPEAADDAPAHRLHRAVHVAVGLEDPAHLAPLEPRHGGLVEVLDVHRSRDPGVLELRLYAEEAHPHAVHDPLAAQEVPPAERQQAAV